MYLNIAKWKIALSAVLYKKPQNKRHHYLREREKR